jgi:hypothetical protein
MIREPENLPEVVLGKSVRVISDEPPKDQVNQGAILRAFSSKDFFLGVKLPSHGCAYNPHFFAIV